MSNRNREKLVVHKIFNKHQYWLETKKEDHPKKSVFLEPLKDSRYQHIYARVRKLQQKYCPQSPLIRVPKVEHFEPLLPVDIYNNITLKERGFLVASLRNEPASQAVAIQITQPSREEPEEPWRLTEEQQKRITEKMQAPAFKEMNILYGRLLQNLLYKPKTAGIWTVSLKEMFAAIRDMDMTRSLEGVELMDLIPALVFSQKNVATWRKKKATKKGHLICQPSTSRECIRKMEPHEYVIMQSDPEWTLYGIKS